MVIGTHLMIDSVASVRFRLVGNVNYRSRPGRIGPSPMMIDTQPSEGPANTVVEY